MSKIVVFVEDAIKDAAIVDEFLLGIIPAARGQRIASEIGIQSIAGAKKILTSSVTRAKGGQENPRSSVTAFDLYRSHDPQE